MQLDSLFKKIRADIETYEVDLHAASDKELCEISNRMELALALPEMKRIKEYFGKQKRNPTDIELQALGQAYSTRLPCNTSTRLFLSLTMHSPEMMWYSNAYPLHLKGP